MELGQLEAFERALREGSFTRAADALNLTQPSVSARIAALEEELGGPLFVRGGRQLRLTALGQMFLPYAERALTAVADSMAMAQRYQAGQLGWVNVVSLDVLAVYLLPAPIMRFRAEYPAVNFGLRLRLISEILEMLHTGEATLGFIGGLPWRRDFQVLAHFREPVRAVTTPTHPLAVRQAAGERLAVADTLAHTIYRVRLGRAVTAFVGGLAEQAQRGSGSALFYIPGLMAVRLLLQGQGLAFLPESFVWAHVDAGRLVFLDLADLPLPQAEPVLIKRAGRELDRPSQTFVQMVRSEWRHMLVD